MLPIQTERELGTSLKNDIWGLQTEAYKIESILFIPGLLRFVG